MKKLVFSLIIVLGFLNACDNKNFIYSSSNCDDIKRDCLNKCRKNGKSQAQCFNECEKARGMCGAIKTKGCLQDCNLKYGKNSPSAEQCKKRC